MIHLGLISCCVQGSTLWAYNVHLLVQYTDVIHLGLISCCVQGSTLWVDNVHPLVQHRDVIHLGLISCCVQGSTLWAYNVHLLLQHTGMVHLGLLHHLYQGAMQCFHGDALSSKQLLHSQELWRYKHTNQFFCQMGYFSVFQRQPALLWLHHCTHASISSWEEPSSNVCV